MLRCVHHDRIYEIHLHFVKNSRVQWSPGSAVHPYPHEAVWFFPLLLRNNERIVSEANISDYGNFSLQGIAKENVENIILSFGKKFSEFSDEIYEEALGE